MNVVSIISLCIAFLSFVFSTVWNTANAKRGRDKEYRELIETIKTETKEKSEMQILFKEMNKNLERIVEDNKIMNERIYGLSERIALLEHDQKNLNAIIGQVSILDDKTSKVHQKIERLEHEINKEK